MIPQICILLPILYIVMLLNVWTLLFYSIVMLLKILLCYIILWLCYMQFVLYYIIL